MKRETKADRRARLMNRLSEMGFTYAEANTLRRIEMTLSRWSEHECNGNIQREGEEGDGKPRWYSDYAIQNETSPKGYRIADREAGALKRLEKLIGERNNRYNRESGDPSGHVRAYHQGDPRGCALYIVRESDINGGDISSLYTRGVAVCD